MHDRSGKKASETRSSALWGTGSRGGDSRSSALWGQRRRTLASVTGAALALAMPLAATADPGNGKAKGKPGTATAVQAIATDEYGGAIRASVTKELLDDATRKPNSMFHVIVQGNGKGSGALAQQIFAMTNEDSHLKKSVRREFTSLRGVAAKLTGAQLLRLATSRHVAAITEDGAVVVTSYSTTQQWPHAAGLKALWPSGSKAGPVLPAIAIVDSGIEADRADFSGRVRAAVDLTTLDGNSPGDGRGHGTFVAGIAAGSAQKYAGAAPSAPIVSIDVMDDRGMARVSDILAACDWILANKDLYDIRVANFSLHTANPSNLRFDPLNRAVQKLWFNGVVVVAAAGNYGIPSGPSGVPYSPGNDPFVITVGAADIGKSVASKDDFNAPWSAWGYTVEGFAKPELAAPGRYMVGPVPVTSTLVRERPDNVVAPGYMQLSGTSFAAPAVAGAAAALLARHPSWTPDQVKGALMVTATPTPKALGLSNGLGLLDAAKAATLVNPPNPNENLNTFVVPDPVDGSLYFDADAWRAEVEQNAAWTSAAWTSAAWTSAAWTSAAWTSAAWTSAAWTSSAFDSAAWTSAAWTSAAWTSLAVEDATLDVIEGEGYELTLEEAMELGYTDAELLELGLIEPAVEEPAIEEPVAETTALVTTTVTGGL